MTEPLPSVTGHVRGTQEEQTLSAVGKVISLSKEADQEHLSVTERIALSEAILRKVMVGAYVTALVIGDLLALLALWWWTTLDQINLTEKLIGPGDRIVNHNVAMALLAATTAQVGTVAVIIARYLFPHQPSVSTGHTGARHAAEGGPRGQGARGDRTSH